MKALKAHMKLEMMMVVDKVVMLREGGERMIVVLQKEEGEKMSSIRFN